MSLSWKISSELALWSHRALPVSIIRFVIRALKCREHWRLFGGSLGQSVCLIGGILWNQRHWYMAVMVLACWHVRVLAMTRESIAARNKRTFRCACSGSAYQWHHKRLAVRWRDVWAEVVVHGIAVTGRDGIKTGAVSKRGIRILAARTLVLSSARLVRVVGILLAVDGSKSLGFHHEGLLLLVAQAAPLGSKEFADFTVQHVRVLEGEFTTLGAGPHHERVHRTLDVLIWICHVDLSSVWILCSRSWAFTNDFSSSHSVLDKLFFFWQIR